ncbi:MAG: Rpn family recombination-promoting nuclease/putative transposase, partial [Treponema sp.]|nr:Rpn family recombination-promoting nuclease/putative transposase [Treponema sp.]
MSDTRKRQAKPVEKLTFHDDFMFGAVMRDEEICREALECLLGEKIARVQYTEPQKVIAPLYGTHGIRLDVYAEDDKTVYDVEIQNRNKEDLGKRTRYYQGLLDMDCLMRGKPYTELKRSVIIFLCRFDPYKKGIPCYTVRRMCRQVPGLEVEDGSVTHIFNCRAYAKAENPGLRAFLKYMQKNKAESDLTRRIDDMISINKIRENWSDSLLREYLYELELQADAEKKSSLATAGRMLARNYPLGDIAEITGLTLEQVEKLDRRRSK